MTQTIESLAEIAAGYDAIVLDQWGVLHDGSTPYPDALAALQDLARGHVPLAVLSNSGKRSAPNADRIAAMGFGHTLFHTVMTSGEALYRDIASGQITARRLWPIEREAGDAAEWAKGLDIELTATLEDADAILLMGLPDGTTLDAWHPVLTRAAASGLPVYCSNPDRQSPRADGLVLSPGALAFAYQEMGHPVTFYGKPHRPIFTALEAALGAHRLLMVGDSLEHDIAGGHGAGWDTVLVQGGLYAADFATGDGTATLDRLCAEKAAPAPTFRIETLR